MASDNQSGGGCCGALSLLFVGGAAVMFLIYFWWLILAVVVLGLAVFGAFVIAGQFIGSSPSESESSEYTPAPRVDPLPTADIQSAGESGGQVIEPRKAFLWDDFDLDDDDWWDDTEADVRAEIAEEEDKQAKWEEDEYHLREVLDVVEATREEMLTFEERDEEGIDFDPKMDFTGHVVEGDHTDEQVEVCDLEDDLRERQEDR